MSYSILANSINPALIIYLLDVSASMSQPLDDKQRIEIVNDALFKVFSTMIFRSTKGTKVSPRYRVAILAYSDKVFDVLGGTKTISDMATIGLPQLTPQRTTETAKGFLAVEKLLEAELPSMYDQPAPLVCHMTDGEFTGDDPEPVVRRIMSMSVPDGNVLVENIFISDSILDENITNPNNWPGINQNTRLTNDYARKLRSISSPLPESYRAMMTECSYNMAPGALMMLPGISPELVAMGFQMSAATPIR